MASAFSLIHSGATGNIYQDLRHIEALSPESEWVYGGIRLPYVLLPALNVVTKG